MVEYDGMIDINAASADEIDAVPQLKGHGFEIVRYREDRGRFEAVRQLEQVPGLAGKVAGLEEAVRFG
jgi:competence protein ComEA